MKRLLPLLLLLLGITLQACTTKGPNKSGLTNEELAWLRKTTVENLVFVKGGTFMEGDVGYDDENGNRHSFGGRNCKPLHEVTLENYSILKYEVSYKEFFLFLKANKRKAFKSREGTIFEQAQLPVNCIIWQEANDYCEWLAEVLNLPISLASESQWEYAARSRGLAVEHATDNGKLERNINVGGSKDPMEGFPSGHFPPNPLGIYDMSGSRYEWTSNKVARGIASARASIYGRAFHSLENYGSKGIRLVVNSIKPI